MSELAGGLLDDLRQRLPKFAKQLTYASPQLTLGIEHELFVFGPDGPCDHNESQAIFDLFIKRGWVPCIDQATGLVIGVSSDLGGCGPAWVKYEYDPHLIEISTPYTHRFEELSGLLTTIWELLDSVARRLGLCLMSQPLLHVPDRFELAHRTRLQSTRDLLQLREKILLKQGGNPLLAGFPAWTAATQTHIGGLPWFARPEIVDVLYRVEPEVGLTAYEAFGDSAEDIFQRRWEGYRAVYGTTPLMGFPDFAEGWTLQAWAGALLTAPLAGRPVESADTSVLRMPESPSIDGGDFLRRVRDLQLVKPRLSGTLEFRGDPAQPDLHAIIRVAETRWKSCHEHLAKCFAGRTYQQARATWLSGVWLR